mmetsp:Transcript_55891/g.112028  ORF Transcript_55891/g.112028 Transcript_55891/m.112028 type:complete len:192 (+) Transcript_55891:84-659(+)|eukprot:CAMPEP_0171622518 /NCGR_PEP_ID=MMETSP0990-20121206/17300_1 /TAXON_ID=483369 /ORGANISM="non described non described, Strain CCMP2098" /LENGTH=191 /DNA_ID=CAMNT_0012188349 /DNA_START=80 /DNA_END=655 /DNA_ORIENTATION=+
MKFTVVIALALFAAVADAFSFPTRTKSLTLGRLYAAEWKKKEAYGASGGPGLGTIPVSFKVMGEEEIVETKAISGQPLSELASQNGVFIRYQCKKGECGTCEVMQDGKWIRTCVTKVTAPMEIKIRPGKVEAKKASGFFSPQSFLDGFTANVLGMKGLVTEGAKEEDNFSVRMEREAKIKALTEARKNEKR